MRDLRVVDADPTTGVVTWELDVDEYWANMNGFFLSPFSFLFLFFFFCLV